MVALIFDATQYEPFDLIPESALVEPANTVVTNAGGSLPTGGLGGLGVTPTGATGKRTRPRKFTGPEWDHLSPIDYRIKANREHGKYNRQAVSATVEVLHLPKHKEQLFNWSKFENSPLLRDKHHAWRETSLAREQGIQEFKRWLEQINAEVDLRAIQFRSEYEACEARLVALKEE